MFLMIRRENHHLIFLILMHQIMYRFYTRKLVQEFFSNILQLHSRPRPKISSTRKYAPPMKFFLIIMPHTTWPNTLLKSERILNLHLNGVPNIVLYFIWPSYIQLSTFQKVFCDSFTISERLWFQLENTALYSLSNSGLHATRCL